MQPLIVFLLLQCEPSQPQGPQDPATLQVASDQQWCLCQAEQGNFLNSILFHFLRMMKTSA